MHRDVTPTTTSHIFLKGSVKSTTTAQIFLKGTIFNRSTLKFFDILFVINK